MDCVGWVARDGKPPLLEVSRDMKLTQKKRSDFLQAIKRADDVETLRRLGEECDWNQIKDVKDDKGCSPLHLAVTMLTNRYGLVALGTSGRVRAPCQA